MTVIISFSEKETLPLMLQLISPVVTAYYLQKEPDGDLQKWVYFYTATGSLIARCNKINLILNMDPLERGGGEIIQQADAGGGLPHEMASLQGAGWFCRYCEDKS